jgi:hypothetical protein
MAEFLIKAQEFPRWTPQGWEKCKEGWRKLGYACYTCQRILPSASFADKDVKGTRGSGPVRRYRKRCCIQCGLETDRLPPGSVVKQGSACPRHLVCRQCRELKGGRTCGECKICGDCALYDFEILACETKKGHCCG